jgi:hypothetical protein
VDIDDVQAHYRHSYGRKLSDWSLVDEQEAVVEISWDDARQLTSLDRHVHAIDNPFSDLPTDTPMIFLLKDGDRTYLINTEGYNYCRYAVKAKIVDGGRDLGDNAPTVNERSNEMETYHDKSIRLVDLGSDASIDLLAKFIIQSMAEMHADMWSDCSEEGYDPPTAALVKETAADYAVDLLKDISNDVVKKIREMNVKADFRLELKQLTFSE